MRGDHGWNSKAMISANEHGTLSPTDISSLTPRRLQVAGMHGDHTLDLGHAILELMSGPRHGPVESV